MDLQEWGKLHEGIMDLKVWHNAKIYQYNGVKIKFKTCDYNIFIFQFKYIAKMQCSF